MGQGHEKEILVSPENIKGSPFEQPIIWPNLDGKGYRVSGLTLPIGWQSVSRDLGLNPEGPFNNALQRSYLPPGKIIFNSETGILESITVGTSSQLILSPEPDRRVRGEYEFASVTDLKAALIINKFASLILGYTRQKLGDQRSLAYVDGAPGQGYGPLNLKVPDKYMESETPVNDVSFQERFISNVQNLVRGFTLERRTREGMIHVNMEIKSFGFNKNGVLKNVEVTPGNRTDYILQPSYQYGSHNVDYPEQAAALHLVCASFINELGKQQPSS